MPKSNVLEIWHFAMRNLALFATQSGISLEVNWQTPFGHVIINYMSVTKWRERPNPLILKILRYKNRCVFAKTSLGG
jgi:hypothetical protein